MTTHNNMTLQIVLALEESIEAKKRVIEKSVPILESITEALINALKNGSKILLFGNGGSAADSQHIAAELVSRFRRERKGLPAIALTTDTSILTAIGNDYTFDHVFARQIEALGEPGDVAIGISTSGNSPNVIKALKTAKQMEMVTIGLTGESGGQLKDCVDFCFHAPTASTPHIQEVHITVAHAICDIVEHEFSMKE
ncbi:MAG: Phosphoheptose isomerase [bacterium]|nr:Phosphoheptose isomerase [bacterium]